MGLPGRDRLDVATLRRFGLKVQFYYLDTDQRIAFFGELVSKLGSDPVLMRSHTYTLPGGVWFGRIQ
jgi:hypothetical protein